MSLPVFSGDVEAAREVEAIDRAWIDAFNRGDVDTLVALYADDVVAIPPDHPDLHGREAVAGWMRTSFQAFRFQQELTNDEVHAGPDWAVMRGRLRLTMTPRHGGTAKTVNGKHMVVWRRDRFKLVATPRDGGPSTTAHGKHLVVWRRDDHGDWKAWRDIWSIAPGGD